MPEKVTGLMRITRRDNRGAELPHAQNARGNVVQGTHGNIVQGTHGNIVTMMLVGIGMAATLSLATYQLLSGPVATVSRVTQNNMATAQMLGVGQMVAMDAVNQTPAGDCDADGYVEPRDWVTTLSGLTGGGVLPAAIGVPTRDAWKTTLGYCVWDIGPTFEGAGCGGAPANRLNGADAPGGGSETAITQTVFAIISAGPNRRFETTCRNWNNTDDVIVRGGDDIVKRYTYQEAATATSAVWALAPTDPDVSSIERKAEVGSKIKMDNTQGLLQTGLIQTTGKAIADGGLALGVADGVTCGPAGANEGMIRTKPTLTAGLAAHWKMDEVSGTAVADAQGAYAGTWAGTPATIASTAGKIDTGFAFAGTAQFNVTDPGASNLDFALGDSIGISSWVWIDSASTGTDYIIRKNSTTRNYSLAKAGGSSISFRYYSSDGSSRVYGSVTLPTDQWVHVAFTYTYGDPTTAKLYVNNVACACSWSGGTGAEPPVVDNAGVNVGVGWDGKLDDMRLYRRLLSASDVADLYAYTGGGGGVSLPSHMIGYWKLNETTGTTVADAAGTSTGALTGTTWPAVTVAGKSGGAYNRGGTGSMNVTPSSTAVSNLFQDGDRGAVSFWFKPGDPDFGNSTYITAGNGANGWSISRAGQTITYAEVGGYSVQSEPFGWVAGDWYYVLVHRDNIYINGNAAGNVVPGGTSSADTTPMLFGNTGLSGVEDIIDDIRFYNRPLTVPEITAAYAGNAAEYESGGGAPLPPELVAYWNFDETSGTAADDLAGTSDGTVNGGNWTTSTTTGKNNGAFEKGAGVTLTAVPSSSAIANIFDADGGSVSFWFKTPDEAGTSGIYISTGNGSNGWAISRAPSAYFTFDFYSGMFSGTSCSSFSGTLANNTWHHLVVMGDTGNVTFTLNGVDITDSCTPGGRQAADLSPMTIGGIIPDDAVDDVRFYNEYLTGPEISAIYAAGASEYSGGGGGGGASDDDLIVQYCDGTNWQDMAGGGGAGSGGIKASLPPGACNGTVTGEVRYISGFLYFCDGLEWRTF